MAPTPASSPLHAFLPTSTASYAVRIQVLAHPDLRTEAEKAKQYRKMVNTRARKDKERRERGEDTSAEKASKKRRIDNDDRRNKGEKTSDELAEESRKATDARLVKQGKLTSRQQGAETRNRRRAESKGASSSLVSLLSYVVCLQLTAGLRVLQRTSTVVRPSRDRSCRPPQLY